MLWKRHVAALENAEPTPDVDVASRLAVARQQLPRTSAVEYLQELEGTIGADPLHGQ